MRILSFRKGDIHNAIEKAESSGILDTLKYYYHLQARTENAASGICQLAIEAYGFPYHKVSDSVASFSAPSGLAEEETTMSLTGPPPAADASEGTSTSFIRFVGTGDPMDSHFQEVLQQLNTGLSDQETRWTAIRMLRLARLGLHGIDPTYAELKECPQDYKAVYRVGRLSEVGVQLGVGEIAGNPMHIDVDWFGDGPANLDNWWNVPAGLSFGRNAEQDVARDLLHFLEESMGLEHSHLFPDSTSVGSANSFLPSAVSKGVPSVPEDEQVPGWSWPDANDPGLNWGKMGKIPAPPVQAGFADLEFEWHHGKSRSAIKCTAQQAKFIVATPTTIRTDF